MRPSQFDSPQREALSRFYQEGRAAARHLQTLFWMGGSPSSFILRWSGKYVPEVGERFKASFQQLELHEQWIVEVGEDDRQGIRIFTGHDLEIEDLPAEQEVTAPNSSGTDKQFEANTLADCKEIMNWLKQFDDTPIETATEHNS